MPNSTRFGSRSEMNVLQEFASKPLKAPEKVVETETHNWKKADKLHSHLCAICR